MTDRVPMVALSEVLRKSEERIEIKSEERYKRITVKLWGKGVIEREIVPGVLIAMRNQSVVRPNQFIVSKIDARHGAFGLVSESLDGAIVSNDFPTFNINPSIALPKWLEWASKTRSFLNACIAASEGSTNRVRLRLDRFLGAKIPLPSLQEQSQIASKIEAVVSKIRRAQVLKHTTTAEVANFWKVLSRTTRIGDYPIAKLGDIVDFLDGQRTPLRAAERALRKGPFPYYGLAASLTMWTITYSMKTYYYFQKTVRILSTGHLQ